MEHNNLKSKITGCLLAGAIGNVFGSPFENMHYRDIEKKYGKRLITDILDPALIETEDDCNVALVLCKTYLENKKRINSFDYAEGWLKYIDPSNLYLCCQNSYNLMKAGISPQVTGALNLDTGAAIMAISPTGIYNACDPEQAYMDAIELTEIYARGIDVEVGAVFAAAIAEALKAKATVDSILNTILKMTPNKIINTYGFLKEVNLHEQVERAIDISSRYDDIYKARGVLYDNFQTSWHPIDPVEVFIFTVAIFVISKGDIDNAIVWGANIGRDSDTIANLTGSLSGALSGAENIPERFIKQVGMKYYTKYEKIAKEFVGIIKKKLEISKKLSARVQEFFI